MITQDELRLMLEYNAWADQTMLRTAQGLPQAVLHAPQGLGFGIIFDTLVHMMDAQRAWLQRWQGAPPARFSTREDYETLDQVEAAWEPLRAEFRAYVLAGDPARVVTYTTTRGETYHHPLGLLVWHVLNHAVEHRSELAAMFTRSGFKHERVDLVYYLGNVAKLGLE
jgi:uncharacterized damage-inducible protein DinB